MEPTIDNLKASFPPLIIPFGTLDKAGKNIIFDWLKARVSKLSDCQCSELIARCTELLRKPADGQQHLGELDAKCKLVVKFTAGQMELVVTGEVPEFKYLMQIVAVLPQAQLSEYMKEVIDYIPKAKPHVDAPAS